MATTTKLLENIKAELMAGGRRAERIKPPLLDSRTWVNSVPDYRVSYEYNVAVKIGYSGVFADTDELHTVLANATRAVADYAYREVRDLAMKAQRELYQGDDRAAIATLSEILVLTEP